VAGAARRRLKKPRSAIALEIDRRFLIRRHQRRL
jgi:hypothetical protein